MALLSTISTGWNFMKWIRTIAWIGLSVQSVALAMYPMAGLSLIMLLLTLFNATPCCTTGACAIQTPKTNHHALDKK